MDLWKGVRVVAKCTNCHFACDNKAQCGAGPANISLSVSSVGAHLGININGRTGGRAIRGIRRGYGEGRGATVLRSAWTCASREDPGSTPEWPVQDDCGIHSGKHSGAPGIFGAFLLRSSTTTYRSQTPRHHRNWRKEKMIGRQQRRRVGRQLFTVCTSASRRCALPIRLRLTGRFRR